MASTNSRPKKTCEITFRYEGAKENTFLCVEFHSVRAANPLCTTPNYTLQILINRANNTKDLVGVRSCQNPEPLKWCSNSTEITLRLLRHGTPEAEEDEVVFYALVLDQAGPFFDCFFCTTTTAEPKVSTVTTARGSDTSSATTARGSDTSSDTNTLAIGLGAAGGVVGLAIVLPLGLL
ncbi:uncharacterized protein [Littorina saxatilis]|uniref:uncharacterized protein n=1 Tax=Littorina saxatilis TaxID=31220 RepID=UPI0038B668C3